MGRKRISFFLAVSFLLATIGFAGCGGGGGGGDVPDPDPKIEPVPIKLSSIAITALPDKIIYAVGEELDIAGLVVTGTYSDGSKKTEAAKISNVSGFDSSVAGDQILTVTVGGKTATFKITVTPIDCVLYENWELGENKGIFSATIFNGVLSNKTELIPISADGEKFYAATYSPDRSKVAFVLQEGGLRDIAILDIVANEISIILLGGYHNHPRWNAEGTKLIFVYKANEASLGDIAMMNLDGSELEFLTNSSDLDEGNPIFNPINDDEIIYHASQGNIYGMSDIYTMEISTGIVINLTNSVEFSEGDPYYSPNGLSVVYDSDKSSEEDLDGLIHHYYGVWIMDSDGIGSEVLFSFPGGQYDIGWPIFSTDGERVYMMPKHPTPWVYLIPSDGSISAEEVENSLGVFITDVK